MRRLVLVSLLLTAGCNQTDPYQREGMWQPTGANAVNLAAMVAQPRDLLRGRGTTGTPGIEATAPVTRYWSGRPTPLNPVAPGSQQNAAQRPAPPSPEPN